jgi:hypothetical protein
MRKIEDGNWVLVDDMTGWPVRIGDVRESSRGESYVVTGGRPPLHLSSTGRIHVALRGSAPTIDFFPSVFNARWIDRATEDNELQLGSRYTMDGVQLMREIGGGFAGKVAQAYQVADLGNRRILLDAFEHMFRHHAEMAAQFAEEN